MVLAAFERVDLVLQAAIEHDHFLQRLHRVALCRETNPSATFCNTASWRLSRVIIWSMAILRLNKGPAAAAQFDHQRVVRRRPLQLLRLRPWLVSHNSVSSGVVRITGIAFSWIGAIRALGLVVRKPKILWSPGPPGEEGAFLIDLLDHVICLVSALQFHEITLQLPRSV